MGVAAIAVRACAMPSSKCMTMVWVDGTTSANRALSSTSTSVASPGQLNGVLSCAARSAPISVAAAIWAAAHNGHSSMACQTAMPTRPPDLSTRCISRAATSGSGKNCSPCWQVTTSAVPSGRSTASAGASPQSQGAAPILAGSLRATSTIAGVMSRPTTRPAAPRTGAAKRTTIPVPQATSRSVSPGCKPRRIRRVIAQGANKRGTRMSSYTCAELELPNAATKLSACPPVLVTPRTVPPKVVRRRDSRAMVRCRARVSQGRSRRSLVLATVACPWNGRSGYRGRARPGPTFGLSASSWLSGGHPIRRCTLPAGLLKCSCGACARDRLRHGA